MVHFLDGDLPQRQWHVEKIDRRWEQLYHLEKEWHAKAWKYLFLCNSGGAIAMLSFLGSKAVPLNIFLKLGLSCFILGVIVVGICIALRYHSLAYLFEKYKEDANNFLTNKLSWEELLERDNERVKPTCWRTFWGNFWPYLSFLLFIVGCLVGGYALLNT